MSEEMKELMNAIGALAELLHIAYQRFIGVGFREEQAMLLCAQMLNNILPKGKGAANRDD